MLSHILRHSRNYTKKRKHFWFIYVARVSRLFFCFIIYFVRSSVHYEVLDKRFNTNVTIKITSMLQAFVRSRV